MTFFVPYSMFLTSRATLKPLPLYTDPPSPPLPVLTSPPCCFLQAQCEALEASQQPGKVERLCSGRAGPDCLGTGSVSGFGDWRPVAKAIP